MCKENNEVFFFIVSFAILGNMALRPPNYLVFDISLMDNSFIYRIVLSNGKSNSDKAVVVLSFVSY